MQYQTPASVRLTGPLEASVRIPAHRGRAAMQALSGMLIIVFCITTLILHALHVLPQRHFSAAIPAAIESLQVLSVQTLIGLAIGVISGSWALLRGIARLQDGDAGLVVGPTGLTINSEGGTKINRIPWTAVRRFEARRFKGRAYIAVHVNKPERYLPDLGLLRNGLRRLNARITASPIVISTYWLQIASADLELLLQKYFQHYSEKR